MNARDHRLSAAIRTALENLENRVFLSADVWVVNGDYSRRRPSDSIVIDLDPANRANVRAVVNGAVVGTRPLAGLDGIQVAAGRGNDRVSIEMGIGGDDIPVVTIYGGDGNDSVFGDCGDQLVYGGAGDDFVDAAAGDDTIYGETGNDDLSGDDGSDCLDGGVGNDTLSGDWGMDRLSGGAGGDWLDGGEGRDKIAGGADNDVVKGGSGRDAYDGGTGRDWIYYQAANDTFTSDPADRHLPESGQLPMLRSGKDRLKQKIKDLSLQIWSDALGTELKYGWWNYDRYAAALNAGAPTLANSGGNNSGQPTHDYSDTNTQEAGVDEADIVETDGDYLYTLVNSELVITDTARRQIVYRATVPGSPMGMYLYGDKLTVITWNWEGGPIVNWRPPQAGYILPTRYREYTRVTTYDVTDRTAPKVFEQTDLDGDYVNSRAIGDRVYVVVSNAIEGVVPAVNSDGNGKLIYESRDSYLAHLDQRIEDAMPGYAGTDGRGRRATGTFFNDSNYWSEVDDENWWYEPTMSVAMLDVSDGVAAPVADANVAGWSGDLYVSGTSMYIAEYDWSQEMGSHSNIYKFTLGTDNVSLSATGEVAGHVINQFAMDEEGQYFRIATQRWGNAGNFSSLFVLDQVGEELRAVGWISKIAPGESLQAVRFMGDRGYIVTFQRTDPLFTVDLSNPADPKILGELVIPGYSEYLHPVGDNYLIGLGQSTDELGRSNGVQLSLFNVKDMANPTRVDVYGVDSSDRWAASVAEWDHHAFSYFPESGILAFPVDFVQGDRWVTRMEVVKIDPEAGIAPLGNVPHTSWLLRAVRVGQVLFTIGYDAIIAVNLTKPGEILATIDLSVPPPDYM